MLRRNLWTAGDLINGALGYVREIIYSNNDSPPQLPETIMLEFDNYQGRYLSVADNSTNMHMDA